MSTQSDNENVSPHDVVVLSSINRAIREITKGGVSVLLVPGEVVFAYDIPTYVYNSDEQLHQWVKAALDKHVVLLKADDIKIQRAIEICRVMHFELFAVLDFPEQNVSGSAFSMVSSLPRILHSELDMFGKIERSTSADSEHKPSDAPKEVLPSQDVNAATEEPSTKFAKLAKQVHG